MPRFSNCHNIESGEAVQKRRFAILRILAVRFDRIMAILIALALISNLVAAVGEPKAEGADPNPDSEPIQVTADQLISNNEEMYAEFIGNVKATQGTSKITSDKLRIYYQSDLLKNEKKSKDEELVKKIVATGNVKMESEQYSAETDKLEYDTVTMTYILTGDNSKILSGKNYVTGSKITLYQKDGKVKIERGENSPIKALIYPNDKTSNAFKINKPDE